MLPLLGNFDGTVTSRLRHLNSSSVSSSKMSPSGARIRCPRSYLFCGHLGLQTLSYLVHAKVVHNRSHPHSVQSTFSPLKLSRILGSANRSATSPYWIPRYCVQTPLSTPTKVALSDSCCNSDIVIGPCLSWQLLHAGPQVIWRGYGQLIPPPLLLSGCVWSSAVEGLMGPAWRPATCMLLSGVVFSIVQSPSC